jgi:hypothetical protein
VWGRFHRVDRLVDPTDASAGTVVRFKRSAPERVVSSTDPSHEGLIVVEDFERVQATLNRSTSTSSAVPRSPRTSTTPYLLRGLLHCGFCVRKMEGSRTRKTDIYYRCRVRDTVPGSSGEHPSNVMFREDWLIAGLDTWLTAVFSPDKVEETVEAMFIATEPSMADVARRQVVDRRLEEAQQRLARFKEALAAGVDPHLAAAWINEAKKRSRRRSLSGQHWWPPGQPVRRVKNCTAWLPTSRDWPAASARFLPRSALRSTRLWASGSHMTRRPPQYRLRSALHIRCWAKRVSEGRHATYAHAYRRGESPWPRPCQMEVTCAARSSYDFVRGDISAVGAARSATAVSSSGTMMPRPASATSALWSGSHRSPARR